jgi:hypothetical protein
MHDLARHLLHFLEVLKVAHISLLSMIADNEQFCHGKANTSSTASENDGQEGGGKLERGIQKSAGKVTNDLRYFAIILDGLEQRSQSLETQLRNEISLVSFLYLIDFSIFLNLIST